MYFATRPCGSEGIRFRVGTLPHGLVSSKFQGCNIRIRNYNSAFLAPPHDVALKSDRIGTDLIDSGGVARFIYLVAAAAAVSLLQRDRTWRPFLKSAARDSRRRRARVFSISPHLGESFRSNTTQSWTEFGRVSWCLLNNPMPISIAMGLCVLQYFSILCSFL